MMFYNVLNLGFYQFNILNKYDVSRRLNKINNKKIAYYVYNGRCKYWFINEKHVYLILKNKK